MLNERKNNNPEESGVAHSETEKEKVVWESCCIRVNSHAVAYLGQFTIVVGVLTLSTYMLLEADGDCNKSSPYIGLISFVLGKILSSVVSSV